MDTYTNLTAYEHFSTSTWRGVFDVTLTMKQSLLRPDKTWARSDEYHCRNAFRHFMNLLNTAVYGKSFRRHKKKLRVIPVLENGTQFDTAKSGSTKRWHYHAAIEPPAHLNDSEFRRLIETTWRKVDWGYRQTCVRPGADQGWVRYILKPSQKIGLETWSDSIDWFSFHNPIAVV